MEKQITYPSSPLVPPLPQETTVPCNQAQAYTTCHWTMPSAVIPDHQTHSIPLHLLYWRRQRHSTKAQPLSLKAFQVSKPEMQNRAMFLRLVSSVSWYFAYTITQTNGHWTFGAARWGHYTVHKRRAPIIQWCGAISQIGKDVKLAAAKARNLACIQEWFYLTITQAYLIFIWNINVLVHLTWWCPILEVETSCQTINESQIECCVLLITSTYIALIFNIGTTLKWLVWGSGPLHHWEEPRNTLNTRVSEPQSPCGFTGKETNQMSLPGFEFRNVQPVA